MRVNTRYINCTRVTASFSPPRIFSFSQIVIVIMRRLHKKFKKSAAHTASDEMVSGVNHGPINRPSINAEKTLIVTRRYVGLAWRKLELDYGHGIYFCATLPATRMWFHMRRAFLGGKTNLKQE